MTQLLSVLVLVTANVSVGAPLSSDKLVDATNPAKVTEVARGFGSAELTEDGDGDPMIEGRINGVVYRAFFYLCEDGKNCKDLLLWAAWEGYDIDMNDVNSWNQQMRFGTAYIDGDGDPCLQMSVNLNYGVSRKNLDDTFDWWAAMLRTYTQEFLANDGEFTIDDE